MHSSLAGRVCVFILLIATGYCVVAQEETNSAIVTVAVSDRLGGAIPNARVHILERSPRNEKEQVTGETGKAKVELQAGTFDLTVTSPGFLVSMMRDVEIRPGEHRQINVVLKVLVYDCCFDPADPPPIEPERAKLGDLEEPTERVTQDAKIRVINGANGRPLPKVAVSVSFLYDKKYDKEIPANYDASLKLETDENGEAHFKFPQPSPLHFFAQIRVDWSHWSCVSEIFGSTEDLVRKGINGPLPVSDEKKLTGRYKAAPGEILVVARPLSFFERLLYPLMKE